MGKLDRSSRRERRSRRIREKLQPAFGADESEMNSSETSDEPPEVVPDNPSVSLPSEATLEQVLR